MSSRTCPSCSHKPIFNSFKFCPACGFTLHNSNQGNDQRTPTRKNNSSSSERPSVRFSTESNHQMHSNESADNNDPTQLRPAYKSGTRMSHPKTEYNNSYTPKSSSKLEAARRIRAQRHAKDLYGSSLGGTSPSQEPEQHHTAPRSSPSLESPSSRPQSAYHLSSISSPEGEEEFIDALPPRSASRILQMEKQRRMDEHWKAMARYVDPIESDPNYLKTLEKNFFQRSLSAETKSRKRARSATVRRRSPMAQVGSVRNARGRRTNIQIGARCELYSHPFRPRGTIRYYGKVVNKPGLWVGVELDEPEGRHDGSINGRQYFECQPLFGLFIKAKQIRVGNYPPSDSRADSGNYPRGLVLRDSLGSHSGSTSIRLKDQKGGGYLPSQIKRQKSGFVPNPYFQKGKKKRSLSHSRNVGYTPQEHYNDFEAIESVEEEEGDVSPIRDSRAYQSLLNRSHDSVFEKMLDPRLFTGIHRYRFDAKGKGRGMSGRYVPPKGKGTETTW